MKNKISLITQETIFKKLTQPVRKQEKNNKLKDYDI